MQQPKISGFSILRNGVKFDYPFLESWKSLLPLVDELVVVIGESEDETLSQANQFAKSEGLGKVRIVESKWPIEDSKQLNSGKILADQTNQALGLCLNDWCFYLQADEVLHEKDYAAIESLRGLLAQKNNLEAVVFQYVHLYGSFDVEQKSRSVYRREIRMIRKSSGARSIGDAQSFRKINGDKLVAYLSSARIFHYGWVRPPTAMREKTKFLDQLYHGQSTDLLPATGENFRYKRFWGLKRFSDTHPMVMADRIRNKNWNWDFEHSPFVFQLRDVIKVALDLFERATGVRLFEYRSYKV